MSTKGLTLLLGLLVACSRGATDPPPVPSAKVAAPAEPPPAPAGPAELALIAPLTVGSTLGDFTVREVHAVQKGVLNIECVKDRATIRLWIALGSETGPSAPAEAGKYAIFYSARNAEPSEAERLAKALAEIVAKHSDVPVPAGMTEFVPTSVPL